MVEIALYFLAYVCTCFIVVYYLAPEYRRSFMASMCFGVLVAWAVVFFDGFSGIPKDEDVEWRELEGAEIITYRYAEPDDLYLWLVPKHTIIPVAYRVDFHIDLARRLKGSFDNKGDKESVFLNKRKDGDWSVSVMHPEPVRELPTKNGS